jgi:hypothetical protein
MMMSSKFFPIVLMVLDFCASTVYLFHGDLRRTIYWASAGVLTATVTF